MQTKKRFTETNIWEHPFFMELDPVQKTFWFYINDRCNNIGVWVPNFRLAAFHCGIDGNVQDFADRFLKDANKEGERIKILHSGDWFLIEFVAFQYGKLNPANRAHKSYLKLMAEHGLMRHFKENHPGILPDKLELYENSKRTQLEDTQAPKDKEKETDKEKDKEADKEKEKDPNPDNSLNGNEPKFPGNVDVPDFVFGAEMKKIREQTGDEKLTEIFSNVQRTEKWSEFSDTHLPEGAPF